LAAGVRGLAIGVIRDFGKDAPAFAGDVAANLEKAEAALRSASAHIVTLALPAPLAAYRNVSSVINWGESLSIHEKDFHERPNSGHDRRRLKRR